MIYILITVQMTEIIFLDFLLRQRDFVNVMDLGDIIRILIQNGGKILTGEKWIRKMRIKLHNSLSKKSDFRFLFDEKMIFHLSDNFLRFRYRIDDWDYFLRFDPETKEFEEWYGFGVNRKLPDPDWWKKEIWKEI